jgi:predicted dehydrogenase
VKHALEKQPAATGDRQTATVVIVGCGFVADFYMRDLSGRPGIRVVGSFDHDMSRGRSFSDLYNVPAFSSLDELLDETKPLVALNLTSPASHAEVTRDCLEKGVHVYSEKPLAMDLQAAIDLVELAEARQLRLAVAPCTLLSETAQTMWKAIREGKIGRPHLAFVELDEGFVPQMPYHKWFNQRGIRWPADDEFRVGCTLEHTGYALSWLCAFFGPVQWLTASAAEVAEKNNANNGSGDAPDVSVTCLGFADDVVARLTCTIVAPHNHQCLIVGDEGILHTKDIWQSRAPVYTQRRLSLRRRQIISPWQRRLRLQGKKHYRRARSGGAQRIDFGRGVIDLIESIHHQRRPRLNVDFSLHLTELALAIHHARDGGHACRPITTFEPVQPMPWA